MILDPNQSSSRDFYRHMIAAITPRPIGWISSISADGITNLAPFSFFNGVGANPPAVMFAPLNNRHGQPKDTLRNVQATRQFVANIVPFELAERMNATSAEFEYGVSEFERCGVTPTPSQLVRPPRVAESPVSMECEVHTIVPIGEGPLAGTVVIGRVLLMHVDERVLDAAGQIDPAKIDTIARMGGAMYARTTNRFEMDRPAK